ncbi:hypothetical protein [Brevundimonas goettingensis]|uniref:DUF5678 domain-containing protein n=1 Tax=Brevundimonas goettingensis TaxID=2774190 RepID=A0A975C3V2_9CAUL|nr:hypothetical protein [Brevundimonas goettingensis]QTC90816.1 hypothetical protein IFJ75_16505 [Brevundimonas goettingensis]
MNTVSLEREIRAYESMLPEIKREYGSVWAVISHEKLVSTFKAFSDAARFVNANCRDHQVLIRHTDQHNETAPFVEISN